MSDREARVALQEVVRADPPSPEPRTAESALGASAAPERKDGILPIDAAADLQAADAARYRRRVLLVLSAMVLALVLYWASGYFFAYTDDAYVTSDLVSVAPYISGRIVSVNIVDNQTVKKGELLATIDPTPFQLALNEKQAKRTEAEAQLAVDRDVIAATQAQRPRRSETMPQRRSGWRTIIYAELRRSQRKAFSPARRSIRPRRRSRKQRRRWPMPRPPSQKRSRC